MLAMDNHAVRKGFRKQSASLFNELLGRVYILAQFIGAREIHGALDRDTVLVQGLKQAHFHAVAVLYFEQAIFAILHRAHLKAFGILAVHGNSSRVVPVQEASAVLKKVCKRLPFFHFKGHGTFDTARHAHFHFIRRHKDDIALFQTNVSAGGAFAQILVHIQFAHHFIVADHLDVTQGTGTRHTSRTIQCVESGSEGRQHVRTGMRHIAQNIHLDTTDLAQAQTHVRAGAAAQATVNLGEALFQVGVGFLHGHAVQIKRPKNIYIDAALRRNGAAKGGLVASENVDDDFVSRAQLVIAGCSQILTGSEIQILITENVASVNIAFP